MPSTNSQTQVRGTGSRVATKASVPERAVLELPYEVGTHQGLEEARNLFDGLRNLRTEVLGERLQSCTSIKTVRLFLTWARETKVVDVQALQQRYTLPVGSDKRWITRMKDGNLLSLISGEREHATGWSRSSATCLRLTPTWRATPRSKDA